MAGILQCPGLSGVCLFANPGGLFLGAGDLLTGASGMPL